MGDPEIVSLELDEDHRRGENGLVDAQEVEDAESAAVEILTHRHIEGLRSQFLQERRLLEELRAGYVYVLPEDGHLRELKGREGGTW